MTNRYTPTARHKAVQIASAILDLQPVYLDTETTGLDRDAEIVEISILDANGATLFESLVRPRQPIPADAIWIHGITNDMVQSAPTWPAIWPTVRSLLLGRTIAIYNAEYDLRLMQQSHSRYRLPWREQLKTFCIMKLYAEYRGEWDSKRRAYRYFSLDQACQHFALSLPNRHRATADSLLARSLLHFIAGRTQPDLERP